MSLAQLHLWDHLSLVSELLTGISISATPAIDSPKFPPQHLTTILKTILFSYWHWGQLKNLVSYFLLNEKLCNVALSVMNSRKYWQEMPWSPWEWLELESICLKSPPMRRYFPPKTQLHCIISFKLISNALMQKRWTIEASSQIINFVLLMRFANGEFCQMEHVATW